MTEIVSIICGNIAEKLVDPIIRQFSYLFCYKSNIKSLKNGIEDLQNKKADVTLSVDAAKRNLQIIGRDVQSWLGKVEDNEKEAHKVLEGTSIVEIGCLNGRCPNLKQRYVVSRKAVKRTMVVNELRKDGEKYTELSYPALPASMLASTSTTGFEVFESRISQTKQVIEALKNERISMIGICGLGGVGKTRMAKEIRDRAKVENLFDEVVMAVFSQNQDLKKIQEQLSCMLGLKLEENNDIDDRGKQLRERLTQGSKILVILDDVWKDLDLGELGIPIGGQSQSKGCKVLITSRDEHVCIAMKTQRNFVIQLLSDKEAWDLFKEKAGDVVETFDLHSIANEVLKECGRLPLAIVTVGTALKGCGKHAWEDALKQLKTSNVTCIEGMDTNVYASLRLSYEYLERKQSSSKKKKSNQLQLLFLLCCLFPEDCDIPVELLVRFATGLRFLNDVQDLVFARHRVQWLVDQLKSCYLLLQSDKERHVKVHDVVRDFGLKEASDGENVYLVRHDAKLKNWPQIDAVELPYTAISISSEEELELPPGLECSSLRLLQFSSEGSIQISRNYFGGMKELRVVHFCGQLISLDFENTFLESPPKETLQFFMNVRTLCLEHCRFSTDIGFIGSMRKLEILSFICSKIDVLPSEIGQLKNLKLLDLRGCLVGLIPPGVLSSLKNLEDLYMGDYFHGGGVEERNQGNCASITELYSLPGLKTLQVSVSEPKVNLKLKDFFFDRLTKFCILINSDTKDRDYSYECPNKVVIKDVDSGLFIGDQLQALVRRAEVVSLSEVNGWTELIRESDENTFMNLKELVVDGSNDLAEICHGNFPVGSMGMLEKVKLSYLSAMTNLSRGRVHPPCFVNLKVFNIDNCDAIRSLFSPSKVRCLVQLQKLKISKCDILEEIVSKNGAENNEDAKMIEFPKLKKVKLDGLPNLKSFISVSNIPGSDGSHNGYVFNEEVLLPSMETLILRNMESVKIVGGRMKTRPFHKLRFMDVYNCHKLSCFAAFEEIQLLKNLEKLDVFKCNSMEALFDLEGVEVSDEDGTKEGILCQLESIQIEKVDELRHIWKNVPEQRLIRGSFHKLTVLDVFCCNKLRYLFSPCIAKVLVNLQLIKLRSCDMMEQVIMMVDEKDKSDMIIVFPQLLELYLADMESIKSFYEGISRDLEFPSLEEVSIQTCFGMKTFCSGSVSTPKLQSVSTQREAFVWMGDLNNTVQHINKREELIRDQLKKTKHQENDVEESGIEEV